MNLKGLFYIMSGWQIPYYRLEMSQWFTLDPIPHDRSTLFQKSIEIEGREPEICISQVRFGKKYEISGMKLVTPINTFTGEDGVKYIEYRDGKYGFRSGDGNDEEVVKRLKVRDIGK